MRYFPAFFDVAGKPVLIIGAGETAFRKARLFAKADARLVFMSDTAAVAQIAEAGFVSADLIPLDFASPLFKSAALCVAATGDEALDRRAVDAAQAAGTPVNAVDRPELCDFTTPSIVDRGDVVIGVSTGGAAPVFGRRLRERIEALLPARTGALVEFARTLRDDVGAKIETERGRKRFWERFFDGAPAARFLAGDAAGAKAAATDLIASPEGDGVVHIVGAGPGDPDLLTLKALRLLQSADVVFYDSLVSSDILDLARRDAERVDVGKRRARHTMPQEAIGERMIERARGGETVVRLKGGDPFVFGRGGEEVDQLRTAGVAVTVTPGVTAAVGCASSADVPLTHRDLSQAVTFVTGHAKGDADPDLNWGALAALGHTLVVYMGV
ncbi:MAG: siroheme synthase CysG, partial [Pseudomonadota bacterium]